MKTKRIFFALSLIIIGILVGFFLTARVGFITEAESQSQPTAVKQPTTQPIAPPVLKEKVDLTSAVSNVATLTGKAVVSISTEHTTKLKSPRRYYFGGSPFGGGNSPFGDDDIFKRFFEDFYGDMPDREFKQRGLGSGVIIDAEGHILTNEHVVGEADKITVTLPDGREFKGELKGRDLRSDLAIIKINADNLPVAKLGDSNDLKIGQWVVAIGNPFGFALDNTEPTVTVGVISALHRSLGRILSRERDYGDLIQTDAAINPGNSGGPLVNLSGEVVGINVAIFSTSGGYQGIGFAIPISSAKSVLKRLIEGKKILYGWLGVTVQNLTDDMSKYFGMPDKNGVLVANVLENGPAQKAGLKEGDIIKEFDGKAINSVKDLVGLVSKTDVGKKAKVIVIRDKKQMDLTVDVGERPETLGEGESAVKTTEGDEKVWRGMEVEDLNSPKIQRYGIKDKKGVLVVNVESSSPAAEAGISVRDIIVEINKQGVGNISDYQRIIKGVKGDALVKTTRGYFLIKSGETKQE